MGKKSRNKQVAKQIKPIKKRISNPNLLPVQSNQPKSAPPYRIIRGIICTTFTALSAAVSGYGGLLMSNGNVFAPWLLASAAAMVAIAILTSPDTWEFVTGHLRKWYQQVIIIVIICVLFFVPVLIVFQNMANDQRADLSKITILNGELIPGKEPTPSFPFVPLEVGIPRYDFVVMLGDNNAFFITGPVDNTFYLQKYPFLTIKSTNNGRIVFDTQVIDSSNNTIVKIKENEFKTFEDYSFSSRQPDKHSLVVKDVEGVEVLNIKYINSKVLKISGRFFSPEDSQVVTVSPNGEIDLGGITLWGISMPANTGEKIFLGEPPEEFIK